MDDAVFHMKFIFIINYYV